MLQVSAKASNIVAVNDPPPPYELSFTHFCQLFQKFGAF